MTFSERATAVASLGFTPRQATFLTIVALHSGYCLRRQYAAFTGQQHGKNVRDFCDRLVDRGLAERLTFRADRGSIYHLCGRRLYDAIDQSDNRNRRHASPALIARKLMLLDFVLSLPDHDWYATEAEKVDLFTNRLGLPSSALPQKTYQPRPSPRAPAPGTSVTGAAAPASPADTTTTRFCIQKLPLFVQGSTPTVHFVCLVTESTAQAIESFIRDHAPLIRRLEDWRFHVVVPRRTASESACTAVYDKALALASMAAISKEDVEWFATARQRVLGGDLRQLSVGDLQRYRDLVKRLDGRLDGRCTRPPIVHGLPYRYEQFGSHPGIV